MSRHEREYDWLDDPFDEKKSANLSMGGGSKAAIGIGCLVALILMVVLVVMAVSGLAGVAATM